jgi:ABC-type amino acid transport substrate-binding protein
MGFRMNRRVVERPTGLAGAWRPHLLLVVMAALLAGCARQQISTPPPASRLEQITQAGMLRVGVAPDAPPFAYLDRQGELQGYDVELAEELARRMGVELAWTQATHSRLAELVQQGKVDAAIGAIPYSEEWEQRVDCTQVYYGSEEEARLCIILPQGEAALAERMSGILAELEQEGVIERLAEAYLAPHASGRP